MKNADSTRRQAEALFTHLLHDSQRDPNILAFWLSGSRGKGLVTSQSDYDCTMIVTDDVLEEYMRKYERIVRPGLELRVTTLGLFAQYAEWGSPQAWDRYSFAHVTALVDKTGEAQKMIREKSCVPPSEAPVLIRRTLDHYVNQVYRSLKCARDGQPVAARLEAAEQIGPLLDAIFALNGRLRPYFKYLEWELSNDPIPNFGMSSEDFVSALLAILTSGAIRTQQVLLSHVEELFRKSGYGDVFDAWGQELTWMKHYSLPKRPGIAKLRE